MLTVTAAECPEHKQSDTSTMMDVILAQVDFFNEVLQGAVGEVRVCEVLNTTQAS